MCVCVCVRRTDLVPGRQPRSDSLCMAPPLDLVSGATHRHRHTDTDRDRDRGRARLQHLKETAFMKHRQTDRQTDRHAQDSQRHTQAQTHTRHTQTHRHTGCGHLVRDNSLRRALKAMTAIGTSAQCLCVCVCECVYICV